MFYLRMEQEHKQGDLQAMKMITAVIKPFKLDEVRDALTALGIEGLTVTEVRGYGKQKGGSEAGDAALATLLPKIKLEVAVTDDVADRAVAAIRDTANTGRIGDGKIFVYELSQVVRIRTGDENEAAL